MSEFENPHPKGTSKYRRRRIRNLLGFDSPATITDEAQLHNTELLEVLRCVEEAVKNADNSQTEGGSK